MSASRPTADWVTLEDLEHDPHPTLARIAEFLGESFTLGPKVEACIKPALHRQRTGFSF